MKNKLLFLSFILISLVQLQAQAWKGKYKLQIDPADRSAFFVQVVPESVVDGSAAMRSSGSVFYLVVPQSLSGNITKTDVKGNWNLTWTAGVCGNTRLVEVNMTADFIPSTPLTNGTPVNLVRIDIAGDFCNLGAEGIRFFENSDPNTGAANDPCPQFVSAENAISVNSYNAAFMGTLNGPSNPLTCPPITLVANDDAFPTTGNTINPITGGSVGNVLTNDTYNGGTVNISNVTISVLTPAQPINGGPIPSINVSTGEVTVPANIPAGTYTITYTLCENRDGLVCDNATVTIIVPLPQVVADDDNYTSNTYYTGTGGTTASVLVNDKYNGGSNGSATTGTSGNVTLTATGTWPTGISLNTQTGIITIASGATVGTHNLTYQLCDKLNTGNCDTANVTLVVSPNPIVLVANNDNLPVFGNIYNTTGGFAGNVLSNDTHNGGAALPTNVTISVITPAQSIGGGLVPSITITTGEVIVPENTPAGTYTITYQICAKPNGTPCKQAVATIVVTNDSTLSVFNNSVKEPIVLYPNPSSDIVNVLGIPKNYTKLEFQLFDASGRLMKNVKLNDKNQFDISHLPQGMYLVSIVIDDNTKITKPIIKK